MTRTHVFTPPPHLADVAHQHICPTCGTTYACYSGARHDAGSPRPCGSAPSVCFAPKKPQEKV